MSEVYVGKTLDGFPLALSHGSRTEHVQIIASTGRGKTWSVIAPWLIQDFLAGRSVILIDGKGDQELAQRIREFARDPSDVIAFDLGDLDGSATTNPIEFGTPQQIADRIFATFEFENHYYETVSYEAMLLVLEIFRFRGIAPTFREIYGCLIDDGKLTEHVGEIEGANVQKLALSYLGQPFRDRQERISGLLSQLRPFAVGELSDLVNGEVKGRPSFSLSRLIRDGEKGGSRAILILIPALLYQKAAARLGQMFLQEIAWASASRQRKDFLPVFLDEFSAFVYEGFLQLLNKARSSNIALHLSHQSMGDLEAVSDDFAKAIVANTNVKCVLGVNEPETAEFFARLFGTRSSTKATERAERKMFGDPEMSGLMSVRDVEQYRIHPNRLKSFSRGEGVLSFMLNGEPVIEEVQFETVPEGL
jgi:hypothetical protein